jgi:UMF1 family MFS transporter
MVLARLRRKPEWSWALNDWANSAFATTVMAGFFPVFFKDYWNQDATAVESTFRLGLSNATASILVALSSPLMGALGDRLGARKRFLFVYSLMAILSTGCLSLVAQGNWQLAAVLYVLGALGFSGGNVFYDALMLGVCERKDYDRVSALGYSLGYLGGGLLYVVNVCMILFPQTFGLADKAEAVRAAFVTVAIWWALFAIPMFAWVPELPGLARNGDSSAVLSAFRQLRSTLREIRHFRVVALFLAAYWLYIDGVDTIIRMAVDYGMSLGFPSESLLIALGIVQFVGFPAALGFGLLGRRRGTKLALELAIVVYLGITIWGYFLTNVVQFYCLAIMVGLVQGGVQSLSRSMFARIIPPSKAAEFFGFYNVMGRFAAVLGPLMMGGVGLLTGSSRLSILSISILFIAGGTLLWFVDEEKGHQAADEWEAATR